MPPSGADLRLKNVIVGKIRWISLLHGGIVSPSTDGVHNAKFKSPLHFDTKNIWQTQSKKLYASARRVLATAMVE